ncbi:MAG: ATP-binding cassette domain-containing protein [Evtepia sp.]
MLEKNLHSSDHLAAVKRQSSQLIPRFYDVTKGRVKVDGQDVRQVTQASLRRQIGIVQQEVFLFADSIMENIRYGRPDATDEEVMLAARRAEIHEDILTMPNGYDSYVGERGVMLSGGQIAAHQHRPRLLKNPPIVILDEATSAFGQRDRNEDTSIL